MAKIERKLLAHYIDAAEPSAVSPLFVRLGADLEELTIELSAQVDKKKNIIGETSTNISGYEPSAAVEPYYAEPGTPLHTRLSQIVNRRLVLDDLRTTMVDVELWTAEVGDEYDAWQEEAFIEVVSYGGDTTGVQIPFNLHLTGKREKGVFDINERTFTPQDADGGDGGDGGGNDGKDGVTYIPSVSADGWISWSRSDGGPVPAPVYIGGPKGDTGEKGLTGDTGPAGPNQVSPETDVLNIPNGKYLGVAGGKVVGLPGGGGGGSVSIASLKKGVRTVLEGSQTKILDEIQNTVDATLTLCEAGSTAVTSATLNILGENWLDLRDIAEERVYSTGVILKKTADGTISISHPAGKDKPYRLKLTNYTKSPTLSESDSTPVEWFVETLPYSSIPLFVSLVDYVMVSGSPSLQVNLGVIYSDQTAATYAKSSEALADNGFSFGFTDPAKTITAVYLRIIPGDSTPYEVHFKPMVTYMAPKPYQYIPFTNQPSIALPALTSLQKSKTGIPVQLEKYGMMWVDGDKPQRCVFEYDDIKPNWVYSHRLAKTSVPGGAYAMADDAPAITYTALNSLSYANFINQYETLRTADGGYITREEIGQSATGTNTLYSYRFKVPPADDTVQKRTSKMPKILLMGGMHGGSERPAYYGLYLFMHQLATAWKNDPLLEFIRFNTELVVVPRLNTFATRQNANGVDINRNFYTNWMVQEGSGTAPMTEAETQAAYGWLAKEGANADFFIDVHNLVPYNPKLEKLFLSGEDGSHKGLDPLGEELRAIGNVLIRDSFVAFQKKYESSFGTNYTIVNAKTAVELTSVTGGSIQSQARALGIPMMTSETRPLVSEIAGAVDNDEYAQRIAGQQAGNAVLAVARALMA